MQNKKVKKILSNCFMLGFIGFLALSCFISERGTVEQSDVLRDNFELSENKYGLFLAGFHADVINDYVRLSSFYDDAVAQNNDDFLDKSLILYSLQNNQDELFKAAKAEHKKNPQDIIPVLFLSNHYFLNKDYKKAYDLLSGLKNRSNTAIFKLLRSWVLVAMEQYDDALDLLETELENIALNKYILIHLAIQAEFAKDFDYADELYDTVSKSKQLNVSDLENIAAFYIRRNKKDKAIKILEDYCKKSPDFFAGSILLNMIKDGSYTPISIDTVNKGFAKSLFDISSLLNSLFTDMNDLQLMFLFMAKSLYPDFYMANLIEADVKQSIGFTVPLDDDVPETHYLYLVSQLRKASTLLKTPGSEEKGVNLLIKLSEKYPAYPHTFLKLANFYNGKDNNLSVDYFTKAIPLTKNNALLADIFFQRGQVYDRLNLIQKAHDDFSQSLNLNNNSPAFLNYFGYFLVINDMDLKEGLSLILKAVDKDPTNPYFLDSYGWALFKGGNYKQALKFLELAKGINPKNSIIIDHLADIYWTLGRKEEAVFEWKKALAFNNSDEESSEHLNINKVKYKINYGL